MKYKFDSFYNGCAYIVRDDYTTKHEDTRLIEITKPMPGTHYRKGDTYIQIASNSPHNRGPVMTNPVYWASPLNGCDVCCADFPGGIMYDAVVSGMWGNVCQSCFSLDPRAKLGTGFGQKYEKQVDGRWLKVEG